MVFCKGFVNFFLLFPFFMLSICSTTALKPSFWWRLSCLSPHLVHRPLSFSLSRILSGTECNCATSVVNLCTGFSGHTKTPSKNLLGGSLYLIRNVTKSNVLPSVLTCHLICFCLRGVLCSDNKWLSVFCLRVVQISSLKPFCLRVFQTGSETRL